MPSGSMQAKPACHLGKHWRTLQLQQCSQAPSAAPTSCSCTDELPKRRPASRMSCKQAEGRVGSAMQVTTAASFMRPGR